MTAPGPSLRYAIVTPVRDEALNLRRLAASVAAQTHLPTRWIIVDNASSDETGRLARQLGHEHPWIAAISVPGTATAMPGAPIVRAFHAGLRELTDPVDVVVKVDADVSVDRDHFERLVSAFERDPRLGIAGGRCYELEEGEWRPTPSNGTHVRGAVRAYRSSCLADLLPLPERTGWDTLDEYQASARGWTTRTIDELGFNHHRAVGARDGGRFRRWRAKGEASHYVGYRPLYLVLRALYNCRSDPAAIAMVWGYAAASVRREPRHPDDDALALLRGRQRVRDALLRGRERRTASLEP